MAFIFRPDADPRRETVAETYAVGEAVNFRGNVMPATILSGPHKTHGAQRWLITKADGTVSLVRETELSKWLSRRDAVARAMHQALTYKSSSWAALPNAGQLLYLNAADAVLKALDVLPEAAAPAKPGPLKTGDRIRILETGHMGANVSRGNVLSVHRVGATVFTAAHVGRLTSYTFRLDAEGTGWERV